MDKSDEWVEIDEFRDYLVNPSGEVYSLRLERLLKQSRSNGYLTVTLRGNGRIRKVGIHILVAAAFVPGRSVKRYWVNHIDTDKTNNHYSNLEWVSPVENIDHAIKHGLRKVSYDERDTYPHLVSQKRRGV